MTVTSNKQSEQMVVSTGAGIAIAGAWLAAAAVTITLLYLVFGSFAQQPPSNESMSSGSSLTLIFLLASPMIAAYCITKVILSKD